MKSYHTLQEAWFDFLQAGFGNKPMFSEEHHRLHMAFVSGAISVLNVYSTSLNSVASAQKSEMLTGQQMGDILQGVLKDAIEESIKVHQEMTGLEK